MSICIGLLAVVIVVATGYMTYRDMVESAD